MTKKIKFCIQRTQKLLELLDEERTTPLTKEEKYEIIRDVEIEIPEYVIGVGIITEIDNYLAKNNLDKDGWELLYVD